MAQYISQSVIERDSMYKLLQLSLLLPLEHTHFKPTRSFVFANFTSLTS